MRKIFTTLATAIVALWSVSACSPNSTEAAERKADHIRSFYPGMTRQCFERLRNGDESLFLSGTDKCFKMTPTQRWQGIWLDEFEGQHFCAAPAKTCEFSESVPRTWLTFTDGLLPSRRKASGREYDIIFIGRRTLLPGKHGHMGVSDHEMIVDRIISVSPRVKDQRAQPSHPSL
ncbi:hypothetical protein [Sphingomonas sp.]|uniref:hypothetical protein n=1 Tax=Sphingomonas sp. TaxID=28214 RepID=UPI0035C85521